MNFPLDQILVVDDAVSKVYQNSIKDTLLGNVDFPWYFNKDVTYANKKIESSYSVPSLSHKLTDEKTNSGFYDFLLPLALEISGNNNLNPQRITRARSFLQFPIPDSNTHNHPHCDIDEEHTVILYYVNDSDGDTFLFDQTLDDFPQKDISKNNFTVKQTVSPKQGRAVIFNGKRYHASSTPTNGVRCILNFDLI